MKSAILLVSFGTTYPEAREKSLEAIHRELARANPKILVYQAYTSRRVIKGLAEQKIKVNTVEEALFEALDNQTEELYVLPTHMIPGREYQKTVQMLEMHRPLFQRLYIASPVLSEPEDCRNFVPVLENMIGFEEESEYVLMGHGTDAEADVRYDQLQEALFRAGYENVHIASVEGSIHLEKVMARLQKKEVKKVILHPLMVVAGDHANHDMAGKEDSYASKLKEAGYQVESILKGLGEYPQFRAVYVEKMQKLMEESERSE